MKYCALLAIIDLVFYLNQIHSSSIYVPYMSARDS